MVERLFFDRIDAEPGGAAINGQHYPIVAPDAHEAQAALIFLELAKARTEIALDSSIGEPMPKPSFASPFDTIHDKHCTMFAVPEIPALSLTRRLSIFSIQHSATNE